MSGHYFQVLKTVFPCISKLFLKIVDLFCPISTLCLLPTCGINTFSTSVLPCPFPSSEKKYFRTLFPSSKNSISKLFLKMLDLFCPISTWCLLPTCGINTFSTSALTCPFPSSKNSISGHYFHVLKTLFPSYFWKYLICFVQFLLDVCCQLVGLTRFQQVS